MWWWGRTDKRFVSQEDKFLDRLRQRLHEHDSQQQERERGEAIAKLRDHPERPEPSQWWTDF